MTKEGKTVTQALLTVFIYALTSFFSLGESIFPFPLNEIIFLIVSVYFSTFHFKQSPFTVSIILLTGLSGILSSEFYWEIVFDTEKMTYISKNGIPLLFHTAYQVSLAVWMFLTFTQNESKKIKLTGLIPIALQLIGIYFDLPLYGLAALLILFIYSIFYVKQYPLLYLWILLFILECTKLWHLASLD